MQLIEELRSFVNSPQYIALTDALAAWSGATSTTLSSSPPSSPTLGTGTRSEPLSPSIPSPRSSVFVMPVIPAPSKFNFRNHDRRRASFPKSISHPNRLNTRLGRASTTALSVHASAVSSSKQLRFSLEVQELVFLPSSPPFRISRAKPTRAHSDPAIQSSASSSYLAPSPHYLPFNNPSPSSSQSNRHYSSESTLPITERTLVSTSAADASTESTTTTFIKIQDTSSSSSATRSLRTYGTVLEDDYEEEDELGISFNDDLNDDYMFQDCLEHSGDEELVRPGVQRHHFVPAKDSVVARRVQADEHHPRRVRPGVLWQVYTAVTGVKELIAWYGSMVYHSSSL
ncbi:hypothetical protein BGZ94_003512 [Podila epigama]|nr:hypothetical protein BGZ94_003512 [Podila epigama]